MNSINYVIYLMKKIIFIKLYKLNILNIPIPKTRLKDVIQRDAELFNTTPEFLNQIALKRNLRTSKGGKEWLCFLDALCAETSTAVQTV